MPPEPDRHPPAETGSEPSVSLSTGTEPDEWRLGEYAPVVVETDGFPR